MDRNEALDLLKEYVKSEAMIRHSLASEAIMRALARELGQDEEKWGTAGLLHDIDVEITGGDPLTHALKTRELLDGKVDEETINAIEMHNEMATKRERTQLFEHALAAGETISGMITAVTLVYPDKKVASVKVKSVTKRLKEKSFASGVNRANIMECEKIGLPIDKFVEISLKAMQEAAPALGM
ncbi:HDIG domain-containing protein [Parelusimicrobium proximum]|uniref:HD domain-containing protein n=1 Tax=Parelusimicrobium proximum TaxID=3228953 RepID=UPI003D174BB5